MFNNSGLYSDQGVELGRCGFQTSHIGVLSLAPLAPEKLRLILPGTSRESPVNV